VAELDALPSNAETCDDVRSAEFESMRIRGAANRCDQTGIDRRNPWNCNARAAQRKVRVRLLHAIGSKGAERGCGVVRKRGQYLGGWWVLERKERRLSQHGLGNGLEPWTQILGVKGGDEGHHSACGGKKKGKKRLRRGSCKTRLLRG